MDRRRALMMAKEDDPVWPIVIESTMLLKKICNNGSITNNTSWRSSGYIEIPDGATKVWLSNADETVTQYGRLGAPISNEQTSDITMIPFDRNLIYTPYERYAEIPVGAKYIYASRSANSSVKIIVHFNR